MSRPVVTIIDGTTQEQIEREMNDEEYAQYLVDKQKWEIEQAERDAKKAEEDAAKVVLQEKLAEIGITPELIEVIKKL